MLWLSLLRRVLALMVTVSVAVGGSAFATPDLRIGADPASDGALHDTVYLSASHDADDNHDHGVKKDCHCALINCGGWNLAPTALDLVDLDFTATRHDSCRNVAFLPHSPSLPLEPPRS